MLVRLDDEHLIEPDSIAWFGWQDAVAMLGFSDLADRVRASWDDERNFADEEEREDWEEMLAHAVRDPADKGRFEAGGLAPIDDPAAALEGVGPSASTGIAVPTNDPLARVALDADEVGWLDYFLCSPKAPENSLGMEEIDGLFTALISGPLRSLRARPSRWCGAAPTSIPISTMRSRPNLFSDLLTRHWNRDRRSSRAKCAASAADQRVWQWRNTAEPGGAASSEGMLLHFDEWRPLIDDKEGGRQPDADLRPGESAGSG